jgi:hypothetical protein
MTKAQGDHRATLEKIFRHPAGGNVESRQVRSLLEALGAATPEHNGNVKVTLGGETEVLQPPRGKDIDRQMIVDLRTHAHTRGARQVARRLSMHDRMR